MVGHSHAPWLFNEKLPIRRCGGRQIDLPNVNGVLTILVLARNKQHASGDSTPRRRNRTPSVTGERISVLPMATRRLGTRPGQPGCRRHLRTTLGIDPPAAGSVAGGGALQH